MYLISLVSHRVLKTLTHYVSTLFIDQTGFLSQFISFNPQIFLNHPTVHTVIVIHVAELANKVLFTTKCALLSTRVSFFWGYKLYFPQKNWGPIFPDVIISIWKHFCTCYCNKGVLWIIKYVSSGISSLVHGLRLCSAWHERCVDGMVRRLQANCLQWKCFMNWK